MVVPPQSRNRHFREMIQATRPKRLYKWSVGCLITARKVHNVWAIPQQVMRCGGQDESPDLLELDPELPVLFRQFEYKVVGVALRHRDNLEGVDVG